MGLKRDGEPRKGFCFRGNLNLLIGKQLERKVMKRCGRETGLCGSGNLLTYKTFPRFSLDPMLVGKLALLESNTGTTFQSEF